LMPVFVCGCFGERGARRLSRHAVELLAVGRREPKAMW